MATYDVRYGDAATYNHKGDERHFKFIKTESLQEARRLYETAKRFAEKHSLNWTIALFDSDGWLIQSETINPTQIIS